MKNSTKIQIIGALALIITSFFACKKDTDEIKVEEQKFSMTVQMASKTGRAESGIVVGTRAELDKIFSGDSEKVLLKKAAEKNNLFIPITGTGTTGPVNPVDPSALCWDEINAYVDANKAGWLATANQTCQSVYVCVTCPNAGGGLFVMYVIKPTSFRCATLQEASASYVKFNFSANDYNGDAVAAHISASSK